MGIIVWVAHVATRLVARPPLQAACLGALIGAALCPMYMYVLAIVVENRWPAYRDQFKAFMPGNMLLTVVFAGVCYLDATTIQTNTADPYFWSATWIQWSLGFAALVVVVLSALDIWGAVTYQPDADNKYHWRQLISATKIWHNIVVYGAYGTLLVLVGVPGMLAPSLWIGPDADHFAWNLLASDGVKLLVFGCLCRWIYYLYYDAVHPKHTTGHVKVGTVRALVGLAWVILPVLFVTQL